MLDNLYPRLYFSPDSDDGIPDADDPEAEVDEMDEEPEDDEEEDDEDDPEDWDKARAAATIRKLRGIEKKLLKDNKKLSTEVTGYRDKEQEAENAKKDKRLAALNKDGIEGIALMDGWAPDDVNDLTAIYGECGFCNKFYGTAELRQPGQ